MAQLALAGAGAVLGSAVGMPYLGFALGSMLGGVLFPQDGPPDQIQEGPRLHDLKVQSSAHGAMLPLVYGTVRIAGNVIWAADLEEQVVTETTSASGGKGGGGSVTSTTRSYIYFASFAVGLCAGAISSVDRVWANGKLVHDNTSSLLDMAVYLGDETQSPDDRIESVLGVGFVPAYRGMAYAVINRLNLSEYGNQIPNLHFEVTA
ncbi:MAG: hypothetical protein ACK5UY_00865 [Holosporales bacterium]